MPAVQTTYPENMRPGIPGMLSNMVPSTIISRTAELAAGVRFGFPVVQGVFDFGCREPTTGDTAVIHGVAVRDRSAGVRADGVDAYSQRESVAIATKGVVWVIASVAVVAGDIVHVIAATGAWAKTGGILVPNGRWETSAAAGAIAQIRFA